MIFCVVITDRWEVTSDIAFYVWSLNLLHFADHLIAAR